VGTALLERRVVLGEQGHSVMRQMRYGQLKNCLLWANFISNLVGVLVVLIVLRKLYYPLPATILNVSDKVNLVFTPAAFLTVILIQLRYERPIRRYLNLQSDNASIPSGLERHAQRKLLNEPFFLIAVDLSMWILAALFFSILYWGLGAGRNVMIWPIMMNLVTGLITVTVAFFLIEHHLQNKLFPHFFPNGGISAIPKTLRIRISTKLFVVVLACNLIPFAALLSLYYGLSQTHSDPVELIEYLRIGTVTLALVFMATSIWLIILVSSNLSSSLKEIVQVLKRIRKGHFDTKVRVTSNDEIGYAGDVVNEMTEGLKERERMRQSLAVAKEVQENLLPREDPVTRGFDIAGVSIYCDETGGDYFDYLDNCTNSSGETTVVVGDVSGHGISSALLMATCRAFLRLRASLPGSISDIVSDVNRQLTRDVEGSGRFMTLFYLVLDSAAKRLRWIRAGHDPAILYDPADDTVETLKGSGLVLGIDQDWVYEENERAGLAAGQIIIIGTDGIWETHNSEGEMFGKAAVHDIVRQHANAGAAEIQKAILDAVRTFQGDADSQDDVTLVVIKVSQQA
jgi:sigma-B regulation protein RsbU (phosphoserine phosphatase)